MNTTSFGIMNVYNNHNPKLVNVINAAWEMPLFQDSILSILKLIARRDTDKPIDNIENITDFANDILMNICDDADLETIIKFIRWEDFINNSKMASYIKIQEALLDIPDDINNKMDVLTELSVAANVLNGDWRPNFGNKHEEKFIVGIIREEYVGVISVSHNYGTPCFKSIELAHEAIDFIGKEKILKAFS